jgi:hypothetical protein
MKTRFISSILRLRRISKIKLFGSRWGQDTPSLKGEKSVVKGDLHTMKQLLVSTLASIVLGVSAAHSSTFYVPDGDLAGFKAAIQAANATPAEDTISLASYGDYSFSTYYVTSDPLNRTALPPIVSPIIIEGNGSLIRRADSGAQQFRLLRVSAEGKLTLRYATVRNGDATPPDGEYLGDSYGSGLRNDGGTLIIEHSQFDNNYNQYYTAAIYTTGPTTITDSRFLDNYTENIGYASAISALNTSSVILKRCYFRENFVQRAVELSNVEEAEISQSSISGTVYLANGYGTGVSVDSSNLKMTNCTITKNATVGLELANSNAVVTHCTITEQGPEFPGTGILLSSGSLSLRNSIVALNDQGLNPQYGQDCRVEGGILLQNTANLIGDGSCNPDFSGDPKLGPLGFYGGTTQVFPLLKGSPEINQGNDLYSEPVDQRGVARPLGPHCDIGAYEGILRTKGEPISVDLMYRPDPYKIICDPLGPQALDASIVGTRSLPARSIDPASLTMGNARPGSARVLGFQDVNRDGIADLTVEFRVSDIYRGVFNCAEVSLLELQGKTRDGGSIVGYVNVVGIEKR